MSNLSTRELKMFATQIRMETVKEIAARGFGHISGSLSVVDALAVLYGNVMRIDPANPSWKDRDKLVMSKGHAGPAVYATLALKGFFPTEKLATLNQPGTMLPSHCDRLLTPGVDMTTGSLGQGVSTAIGLALAQRMDKNGARTFLFAGDGELDEGQAWEGIMFAASHNLDNLTMFVDWNKKQLDGRTDDVLKTQDFVEKFKAFGWNAIAVDGHNVEEIEKAIETAKNTTGVPTCIIMHTVKGKGVKFIENMELNHHITMNEDQKNEALSELEAQIEILKGGVA